MFKLLFLFVKCHYLPIKTTFLLVHLFADEVHIFVGSRISKNRWGGTPHSGTPRTFANAAEFVASRHTGQAGQVGTGYSQFQWIINYNYNEGTYINKY